MFKIKGGKSKRVGGGRNREIRGTRLLKEREGAENETIKEASYYSERDIEMSVKK